MKELEITKGEWQYEIYAGYFAIQNSAGYEASDLLNADSVGSFEAEHNAELICDAGNTAQSCGLLPSELLRQRDRALLTLCNCRETIEMLQKEIPGEQLVLRHEMTSRLKDIETAIKSTEQ